MFDPVEHARCQSCPLHPGCQLVCCPNCGFETVNVEKSSLARAVQRWLLPTAPEPGGRGEEL